MKILNSSLIRSEDEWVSFIKKRFRSSKSEIGIGDDCALINKAKNIVITTDTLIEKIDFELNWAPLEAVGWKSLAQNLSDLASMGAKPHSFLLNLAIPKKTKNKDIERIFKGIYALSKKENIELIGGDLSKSPKELYISITALGTVENKPLLRSKAKVGDYIFVSSPLGGPCTALKFFKKGVCLKNFSLKGKIKDKDLVLDRFFRPPSQTALGIKLSKMAISSCAIDISDGLLKDLERILKSSGVGAILYFDEIPRFSLKENKVSLNSALYGGEEQTLLFTVSPQKEKLLQKYGIKAFKIGLIVPEKHIFTESKGKKRKLDVKGFDHFRKQNRHF